MMGAKPGSSSAPDESSWYGLRDRTRSISACELAVARSARESGAGSAGNGDRRQPGPWALDARRLVLLEIDVDEQRVFGLERLVALLHVQAQPLRLAALIQTCGRRDSLALESVRVDAASLITDAADAELLHQRLAVLGAHAAQEFELFGRRNLRDRRQRTGQHHQRRQIPDNPLSIRILVASSRNRARGRMNPAEVAGSS